MVKKPLTDVQYETKEDYNGDYKFAPIKESQVSRAMTKRYVSPPYAPSPQNSLL